MKQKNYLLTGEMYPTGVMSGIIGPPQAGKTLFSWEQAHAVTEKGDSVLYVGTGDEPNTFFLDLWSGELAKKYGHEVDLEYKYAPNVNEMLRLLGIEGELILGEKNEFQIKKVDIAKSPFVELATKKNVKVVVFDSITAPFDPIAVGGRQNLPLRAQVETVFFNAFMDALQKTKKDIYVWSTHHITSNPTNPYEIKEHVLWKGGKIVGHYTKVIFALEHKDRPHGYRQLHVVRYPNIPEYGKSYDVLITAQGYRATNKIEIEQLKAEAKALKDAAYKNG